MIPVIESPQGWIRQTIRQCAGVELFLLSAKSLYICLLGTLPILIQVVLFIANGVTLHDILFAIPQLGIMEAYWLIIIAVFAVLTPDYARFAVLGASVFVLWGLVISGVSTLELFHDPVGVLGAFAGGSLSVSRSLAGSIITIILGVSLILVQYLRRSFFLAVSLLAVGFVLSLVVQFLWFWDFMKSPAPLVEDGHFKSDFVGVRIVGGSTATSMIGLIGGKPTRQIWFIRRKCV